MLNKIHTNNYPLCKHHRNFGGPVLNNPKFVENLKLTERVNILISIYSKFHKFSFISNQDIFSLRYNKLKNI